MASSPGAGMSLDTPLAAAATSILGERMAACTQQHMDRVAALALSMRCDLYGEYLYTSAVGMQPLPAAAAQQGGSAVKLCCRIQPEHVCLFLEVLNTLYKIVPIQDWCAKKRVFYVSPKLGAAPAALDGPLFHPFELNLCIMNQRMWKIEKPPIFDVDTLAQDSHSVYVRVGSHQMPHVTNRVTHVMNRIRSKTFCLFDVQPSWNLIPVQWALHTRQALKEAYKKVREGWIMDDAMLGSKAWVMNRWDVMRMAYNRVRTSGNGLLDLMQLHNTCSLCHEAFQESDIVIQLGCKHLFHYHCDAAHQAGGIHAWYVDQGKNSCPMCRAKAF
jgi:hypothetical protein